MTPHQGQALHLGPGRHGPGQNVFAYFEDADGGMIELYSDMLQIEDESTYELF
jgi:hypothetical protein